MQRSWICRNYTSFNGLRGLAVLMVFVCHFGPMIMPRPWAVALWPGIDLFFVLSGFLITGILYDSRDSSSFFRTFYTRRALRIFPLYYVLFIIIFFLRHPLQMSLQHIFWSNLFYLSNFLRFHPEVSNPTVVGFQGHPHITIQMGTFWTLCVEEQFYLVWPLVIWLLPNRHRMMQFSAVALAAVVVLRISLFFLDPQGNAESHYLYFLTFTHCDGLLIGAFLALWLRGRQLTAEKLHKYAYLLIGIPTAIILLGEFTVGRRWKFSEVHPLLCTYGYTLVALVAAGILLLSLDEASWVSRVMRFRFLANLGIVSYGFYILHGLYLQDFEWINYRSALHWRFALVAAAFALTYCLAWLSFRYFESPILRLKDRFAYPTAHSSHPDTDVPVPSTVAVRPSRISRRRPGIPQVKGV